MGQNLLTKKWLSYGIFAFFLTLPYGDYAQSIKRQAISSYGSVGAVENVLISQTAGQAFNTTVSSDNTTVISGFQQPSIFTLEEITAPAVKNLNVTVYPNPARQSITIASTEEIEKSSILVTDVNGRSILSQKVVNLLSHNINCASWANGVYLITINDSKRSSKTLRLIISK
ncbi:MAG: T9SS type A sorting domain-containing protein [Saprospiraceae bacterium]